MTTAPPTPPRPATELFAESLSLSPKQREVLEALKKHRLGARASTLSKDLGMHVNTVRGHLDELIEEKAVQVTHAPAKGRGRPALIFQVRVPDNRVIAQEYIALISLLIDEAGLDAEAAAELGRRWARERLQQRTGGTEEPSDDPGTVLTRVQLLFRDMGFDPVMQEEDTIALTTCPFISADGDAPSAEICAMHKGFIEESTSSTLKLDIIPLSCDGACRVQVRRPD